MATENRRSGARHADRWQRFVLAEMIKNSKVDINSLAAFVRSSQIEPEWMAMQLPYGKFACMPGWSVLTEQAVI